MASVSRRPSPSPSTLSVPPGSSCARHRHRWLAPRGHLEQFHGRGDKRRKPTLTKKPSPAGSSQRRVSPTESAVKCPDDVPRSLRHRRIGKNGRTWRSVSSQAHQPRRRRYASCWPYSRAPVTRAFAIPAGPGFTQRQAGGRFSRDEAAAFVTQLQDAEFDGSRAAAAPAWRQSAQEKMMRALPSEQLASELRRRGWTVTEP
jgi:hypothetical protein